MDLQVRLFKFGVHRANRGLDDLPKFFRNLRGVVEQDAEVRDVLRVLEKLGEAQKNARDASDVVPSGAETSQPAVARSMLLDENPCRIALNK
jgi:hypothetical protein